MRFLQKNLPDNVNSLKWLSVSITVILSGLLTIWAIYGIGEYGIALFILTPFFTGMLPAILYGSKQALTRKKAFSLAIISLGFLLLGLFVFAIEGAICITMIAPIAILLTWLGSWFGYILVNDEKNNSLTMLIVVFFTIPATAFLEKSQIAPLTCVKTYIDISATPETVWKHVVEFPQLSEPDEFLFKIGIAYPINARIERKGDSLIRYCNFTTGSFVEPITVWKEPMLLGFSVAEQPEPMKELSFWDVNAPHLHDYFVSKKGQFKLTKLPNGYTRLEGITWYYHNIKPAFYWRVWSEYIVHKIHDRVLKHIKSNAEAAAASGNSMPVVNRF